MKFRSTRKQIVCAKNQTATTEKSVLRHPLPGCFISLISVHTSTPFSSPLAFCALLEWVIEWRVKGMEVCKYLPEGSMRDLFSDGEKRREGPDSMFKSFHPLVYCTLTNVDETESIINIPQHTWAELARPWAGRKEEAWSDINLLKKQQIYWVDQGSRFWLSSSSVCFGRLFFPPLE